MTRCILTTAGRLTIAFALILVATASASLATLRATARVRDALDAVARDLEAERAGFELGAMAREEYLHQAHILLNEDDSHLDHYRQTVDLFRKAQTRVEAAVVIDAERGWTQAIKDANERIHNRLEDDILPAVRVHDRKRMRTLHESTEAEVDRIVHLGELLIESFQQRIDASKAHALRVSEAAHLRAVVAPFAVLAIALIAGAWIVRRITVPLVTLQRAAQRLSGGDLSTRIALRTRDEFAALADGFNHMVAELTDHQARLLQSQKLAALGRVAAGVAHEINNPLAVVLGYARLLRKRELPPEVAEQVAILEDEATQCQRIVDELRAHARPMALDVKLVDLRQLLLDVVARVRTSDDGVGVRAALNADDDLTLRADSSRLRQVISNLVRNALEASPPAGEIVIGAWRDNEGVCFSVTDLGHGITTEDRARLFEPFFTTKERGSGLGLSICDAIVRAHSGSIEVDSEPSRGSVFRVRLPAADACQT